MVDIEAPALKRDRHWQRERDGTEIKKKKRGGVERPRPQESLQAGGLAVESGAPVLALSMVLRPQAVAGAWRSSTSHSTRCPRFAKLLSSSISHTSLGPRRAVSIAESRETKIQ